jgi:hypothetical protein
MWPSGGLFQVFHQKCPWSYTNGMSKYLLNNLYYPCQCKYESLMRGLHFSHRFWWRFRVFWDMGMKPCRLVNSKDQDHISDSLNHPESTASPNNCRNPVISSLIRSEDLLTEGEKQQNCVMGDFAQNTSRRLNKGMWDGMGNRKCTYSFGWTSSRMSFKTLEISIYWIVLFTDAFSC